MNLSEDGGRVAFLAANNTIYRDGELYREYGNRPVSFPLTLSGDGTVLAWQARGEKDSGSCIVVNGVEGRVYSQTGLPVSSHDGRVVAYRASTSEGSWFIVVDERKISSSFEEVTNPAVSRHGGVVAYAAEGDKAFLFVGQKQIEIPEFASSVFLSQDGSTWGYVTRNAAITAQGRSESFDEIRRPEFSPDSRVIAFAGRQGDEWFVVVGNRKFGAPGLVGGPMWSLDGRQVGYGALLGREIWWKVIFVE